MNRSSVATGVAGVVVLALGPLGASPAAAVGASGGATVPAEAIARLDRAVERLATGRLADAVLAASELAGVRVEEPQPAPAQAIAGVPRVLAGPVLELLAAVRTAEALSAQALRAAPATVDRANRSLISALARSRGLADETRAARRWERRWADAVDRGSLHAAALVLSRTIDRTVPALAAAADAVPEGTGDACDVVDTPVLCIGGNGANTHSADFPLLIDLGGDDTYTNAAGGGDPVAGGPAVSVVIDLGGNDTYTAALPVASGVRVAQGSGTLGGIGVLIDAAGNDTYEAVAGATGAGAWGQGFAAAGVGIHVDGGGNDTYRVSNTRPYAGNPVTNPALPLSFQFYAAGRGVATFGGLGISIDTAGAETTTVEAKPALATDGDGVLHPGDSILAHGFGLGVFGGVGVFADAQHNDTMTVEAVAAPIAADETRPFVPPLVNAFGFGTGGAGVGVSVTGPGIGDRVIRAQAEAPRTSAVNAGGYGRGTVGGYGASHDAGGNDTYRAEAVTRAARTVSTDDSCRCAGADASAQAGLAFVDAAMGAGGLGGVGIIQDAGGNDQYLIVASSTADATAHDGRTALIPPSGDEVAGASAAATAGIARAHGIGFGINGGAGFLLDAGGNDVYDSRATSMARAVATADHPDAPVFAGASSTTAGSWAQGTGVTGHGELDDRQGSDAYTAVNVSTAEEVANEVVETFPGPAVSSVQGSAELGAGVLTDVDGGAADTFAATPADEACTGTKGQGAWRDCGDGLGVGVNA